MPLPLRRVLLPGLLLAGLAVAVVYGRAWYAGVNEEAKLLLRDHREHRVAHAGWSFPARVWSDVAPLSLPKERLVAHARARAYTEACPPVAPGEVCPKTGEVIPRGGHFAEGVQPAGLEGWTREPALEPMLLGWLVGPEGEVREHLPLESAPKHLLAAIVIAEDEGFYEHMGVNPKAALRAAWVNLNGGSFQQGASTLTMQLVRNLTQQKQKTFERKLREAALSVAVDQALGKDEVLGMYLDVPYLGQAGSNSICGFQAAARHYWGVDAADLTLAQAATLAAILPSPGRWSPDRHPEEAKTRRDRLLTRMGERGWDVKDALEEPVLSTPHALPEERWPAYLQAVRSRLEGTLGTDVVYGAGLEVFTALDLVAQQATDELMPTRTHFFERTLGRRATGPLQSAAVLMDANNGNILAIWGGEGLSSTDFNRATQARRQPGSAFKPLVYALGLSVPGITAGTSVPNSPRRFEGAGDWSPRNVGGGYTGTASLAYGLSWSQNIATASLLEKAGGPKALIELAAKIGFDTSAFPAEYGLALGQAEVTPLEMGRMVTTFINGGLKVSGSPVKLAVDASGRVRLNDTQPGQRVLSAEVAALTRDLMRLVIEYGTGGASRGAAGSPGYGGPAVGKTGTTDSEKDLWFVGGTPDMVGVVWLGYDEPEHIGASASDLASPLWGWWMRAVTQGLPQRDFDTGPTLDHIWICTISGLRSNGTCRGIGAPFVPGTAPRGGCPHEHPPAPLEGEEGFEEKKRESLWEKLSREAAERAAAEAAALPEGGEAAPPGLVGP